MYIYVQMDFVKIGRFCKDGQKSFTFRYFVIIFLAKVDHFHAGICIFISKFTL